MTDELTEPEEVKSQDQKQSHIGGINPWIMTSLGLSVILIAAASQVTIFVIQPLGMLPEGKTLVISRMSNTKFIDSADAICKRAQGGVSLFCRIGALGGTLKNAHVYARLPYIHWLYLAANGGKEYPQ
jgi:hypothetical protein